MITGSVFAFVLAVLKAIPPLKDLFDRFMVFYFNSQIASMKVKNADAIRKAFNEYDQRGIEEALGSSSAGKPVDMAGSEIRDSIPGVPPGLRNP